MRGISLFPLVPQIENSRKKQVGRRPRASTTGVLARGRAVTIGLKRHHPARGRVGACRMAADIGFNNAVLSMADSLE